MYPPTLKTEKILMRIHYTTTRNQKQFMVIKCPNEFSRPIVQIIFIFIIIIRLFIGEV